MRVIVPNPCTKFELRWFPFGRYDAFYVSALMGLDTLTSKWRHGSAVLLASFLPIFSVAFHSRLRSGMGRTDRRRPSTLNVPALCGRGLRNMMKRGQNE